VFKSDTGKRLVIIAGKRKAGTTFLFHTLQAEYVPNVKDRDWPETRSQIASFFASEATTGVIAKADALDDLDSLLDAIQSSGGDPESVHVIALDRAPFDRFLSFLAHERKIHRKPISWILNAFEAEEERARVALNRLQTSAISVTLLNYEDVIHQATRPEFIAGLRSVPTQTRGNARSDILPFFGAISRIVEQPWYSRVRDTRALSGLKKFYYSVLVRKVPRKNGFIRCLVLGSISGPVDGQRRITGIFPAKTTFSTRIMDFNGHRGLLGPIRILWQCLKASVLALRGEIDVVYLAISRTKFGLIRDCLLLTPLRLSGARVVAHVHGAEFENFYCKDKSLSKLKAHQLAQIDAFLFIHSALKPKNETLTARSFVLHNPLPQFARSRLEAPKQKEARTEASVPVFGFISSFVPEKGLEDFLALADAFKSKARFQVAGGVHPKFPSYGEDMLARITQHETITYLGYLNDPTLFYETTDFFVFPTSYVSEALPGVLLEALAFGCLSIVKRTNSLPQIFAQTPTHWFDTPEELIQSASHLLKSSPAKIADQQAAGTQWVNHNFPTENAWTRAVEKHLLGWEDRPEIRDILSTSDTK
jgi:glycosyltransferase involved in cell wall biosynthesis